MPQNLLQILILHIASWKWVGTVTSQNSTRGYRFCAVAVILLFVTVGCTEDPSSTSPTLSWYVFAEPSGAFADAARNCSQQSGGQYTIVLVLVFQRRIVAGLTAGAIKG